MNTNNEAGNFKPVDADVTVRISDDFLKVYAKLSPPLYGGRTLTFNDLNNTVRNAGVTFGVQTNVLLRLAAAPIYDQEVLVAEGIAPVDGVTGFLTYHFDTSSTAKPTLLEDGSVDYKNLGIIHNVRKGDLLCTLTPSVNGQSGTDVRGRLIPSAPIKRVKLIPGLNTELSRDGLNLTARTDGQADLINGRVSVNSVYEVNKDVDLSTGHIDFIGNVMINGNILRGFTVKAQGNVVVNGCLDGGEVYAGGNVIIKSGVNGVGVSVIETAGNLRCKYLQSCKVIAQGNVETGQCVGSEVMAGGTVRFIGTRSSVINSHIAAAQSIFCVNVGSQTSQPSLLEVGADPRMLKRRDSIPQELNAAQKKMNDLGLLLARYLQLDKQGRLSDEQREDVAKLVKSREAIRQELETLREERVELDEYLAKSVGGSINIIGTAYPGTRVSIGNDVKIIQTTVKYTTYKRGQDGIEFMTYIDKA